MSQPQQQHHLHSKTRSCHTLGSDLRTISNRPRGSLRRTIFRRGKIVSNILSDAQNVAYIRLVFQTFKNIAKDFEMHKLKRFLKRTLNNGCFKLLPVLFHPVLKQFQHAETFICMNPLLTQFPTHQIHVESDLLCKLVKEEAINHKRINLNRLKGNITELQSTVNVLRKRPKPHLSYVYHYKSITEQLEFHQEQLGKFDLIKDYTRQLELTLNQLERQFHH